MNKYIVVEAETAEEIGAEVSKRLNAPGWFLVGGLSVTVELDPTARAKSNKTIRRYSQAMVYDEEQLRKLAAARAANRIRHRPAKPPAPEPQPVSEG